MLRSSLFWPSAVWALLTRRHKFVLQTGRTDCAVACALTVLNFLSRPADPVHAVDHMDPDRAGTSLDTLRRYFEEQHGVQATSLSVPAGRIGEIKGHVILHMRQLHYVVLLRASRNGVLCFDPAMGPVFYPAADFASLYSGSLLEVAATPPSGQGLPALSGVAQVVGGKPRRSLEPVSLFIIGMASRLLECALLLVLVAVLYLILNRAGLPSMLMAAGLIAVCGAILLVARRIRFEGEDRWIRNKQSLVWRGLLRASIRGRDLNGFRGRFEKDVSGSLRRGLSVTIPQRSQIPATLGAFVTMPLLLGLLSPILSLVHVGIYSLVLIVLQLDAIHVCRRSVRADTGRYARLGHGIDLLTSAAAPELLGETAKWTVIGFAGFSVLLAGLPPVALMFWILAAMQIVPIDFRRAVILSPATGAREPVSGLIGTEVPLRRQRIVGQVDLKVSRDGGLVRIDGISPLTMTLQQPDLTVREQRLIMADIVRCAFRNLPDGDRPPVGPIRIFGPGQDATQADFEHLMIARESRTGNTLPVPREARRVLDLGLQDPVLRDLHSCEPGDFPVFWDVRGRMSVGEIQARLKAVGLSRAAHLTMNRLTVVEAA